MCGSIVDIQSATAEIRRGKKERKRKKKKKPQSKNIMTCPIPQGGHNKLIIKYCCDVMYVEMPLHLTAHICKTPEPICMTFVHILLKYSNISTTKYLNPIFSMNPSRTSR